MYGSGGVPPVAGGVVGGGLAYTGASPTAALIIAGISVVVGALLMIRSRYLKTITTN